MRKCKICGAELAPAKEGFDHTCLPAGRLDFFRTARIMLFLFAKAVSTPFNGKSRMGFQGRNWRQFIKILACLPAGRSVFL